MAIRNCLHALRRATCQSSFMLKRHRPVVAALDSSFLRYNIGSASRRCFAGQVTAKQVKELRDATGAPMMDCKKALSDPDVDSIEDAIQWLRKKGQVKAGKLSERVTDSGLVGVKIGDGVAAIVEISAETDFVARSEPFQELTRDVAATACAINNDSNDALLAASCRPDDTTVAEAITDTIGLLGENIHVKRHQILRFDPTTSVVASYVHQALSDGNGTTAALVQIDHEPLADKDQVAALARNIAMHVVAEKPACLSSTDIPADKLQAEKSFLEEEARSTGKPEKIVQGMVQGRLKKFFAEYCLLNQSFIMSDKDSVEKYLKGESKKMGSKLVITAFSRYHTGEEASKW